MNPRSEGDTLSGLAGVVRNPRSLETGLAWFTLLALAVYAPLETWFSRGDLSSPGYIVDAIAMVLLLTGALHSLRMRPHTGIAPLAAAWGWTACLGWRSYFTRRISRERGLGIYEGQEWVEMIVGYAMIIGLVAFATSLYLAFRRRESASG